MKKNNVKTPKTKTDKITAIAVSVVAMVLVIALTLTAVLNLGLSLRIQTAVKAEDRANNVNGAMMSFFVNDTIMNWYSNYYGYYSNYISLDVSKDFRSQTIGDSEEEGNMDSLFCGEEYVGKSWYEFFVDQAKTTVEKYVIYADAARKNGMTLDDDDQEYIDSIMENIDANLAYFGVSYGEYYGKGVTRNDVRKCYELRTLASKYESDKYEEFKAGVDEAQGNTFAENHKASFFTADCLKFTISKDNKAGKTDAEFDEIKKQAKAAADAIAEAKTPEEFVDLVKDYKESEAATTAATEAATTAETEAATTAETEAATTAATEAATTAETTATTEAEIDYEKEIANYETTIAYKDVKDDKLNDFLFGNASTDTDKIDPAETNDVIVIEETGKATDSATKKEYATYKVTVYFVTAPQHMDHELTHNFAYLVTNSKADAEAFKAMFDASATKNGEVFTEIAKKYYKDMHADENHEHSANEMFAYDYVKKQSNGWFVANGSGYAPVDKWIEDANRKAGETSIVMPVTITSGSGATATTQTQYAVIYFENHDIPVWHATAQAMYGEELLNDWFKAQQEARDIQFSDFVCSQIFVAKPFLKSYE